MNTNAATIDLPALPSAGTWDEIRPWRKQMRAALIAQRLALAPHVRRAQSDQARQRLRENVNLRQFNTIGFYWPIKGEINCRDLIRAHLQAGGAVALPVVVERGTPVEFWNWRPGMPMQRGLWDIPIPATRELVMPDALVVPLVGFDDQGYRLGYGGGYYDRTLAAAAPRPYCVGLGYTLGMLASIYPQAHDLPMDVVVTDRLLLRRAGAV